MRHHIGNTLDRIATNLGNANPEDNFKIQHLGSFHIYHGHHIGRLLVKVLREKVVSVSKELATKLLWVPARHTSTGSTPAEYSPIRNCIFFEALTGSPPPFPIPQRTENLEKHLRKNGINGMLLQVVEGEIFVRYASGDAIWNYFVRLPNDVPNRTQYQVEMDGIAPIVLAVMAGNREITVHLRSCFIDPTTIENRSLPTRATPLAHTTVEMLLHVLLEKYQNTVCYTGKLGSLALKDLVSKVVRSHPHGHPVKAVIKHYSGFSRLSLKGNTGEDLFSFTVNSETVVFGSPTDGSQQAIFPPHVVMPSRYNWCSTCVVTAGDASIFQSNRVFPDMVIEDVSVEFPQPGSTGARTLYHPAIIVMTENQLSIVSASTGRTIFSSTFRYLEDSCSSL